MTNIMGSKYKFNLITSLYASYFCLLPTTLLVFSYLRIDAISSLYFKANDGWCNYLKEGVGVHCFGDFNQGLVSYSKTKIQNFQNHIWLGPFDGVISRVSSYTTFFLSERYVLCVAILFYLTLLLLPIVDIRRHAPKNFSMRWIILLYVGSVPFIASLDRLNSIILSVPFCYFFFCALMKKDNNRTIFLFLAMCVIKPQFALLALAVWKVKGLKSALLHLVVAVAGIYFTVISLGNFNPKFFFKWIQNLTNYGSSGASLSDNYINNLSFSRSFWYISNQIGIRSVTENRYLIFSIFLSLSILSLLVIYRTKISSPDYVFIILSICLLGLSKIVYHYYAVIFLVLELARVRTSSESIFSTIANAGSVRLAVHARKIFFIFLLLPVPIPIFGYLFKINIQEASQHVVPVFNPLFISISAFVLVLLLLFECLKSSTLRLSQESQSRF